MKFYFCKSIRTYIVSSTSQTCHTHWSTYIKEGRKKNPSKSRRKLEFMQTHKKEREREVRIPHLATALSNVGEGVGKSSSSSFRASGRHSKSLSNSPYIQMDKKAVPKILLVERCVKLYVSHVLPVASTLIRK